MINIKELNQYLIYENKSHLTPFPTKKENLDDISNGCIKQFNWYFIEDNFTYKCIEKDNYDKISISFKATNICSLSDLFYLLHTNEYVITNISINNIDLDFSANLEDNDYYVQFESIQLIAKHWDIIGDSIEYD